MPKIYDNVESTGDITGNIEFQSDTFQLTDSTDPTKTWQVNQQGQPPATDVTLYSFESGALVLEPQTSNFQNLIEGQVFLFTPGLAEDYQIEANHNPLSWAITGNPASVTLNPTTGLLSYDGSTGTFSGNAQITVTNQFGTSDPVTISITISAGLQGSPRVVLSSVTLSSFNDNDPLPLWEDISGNGIDWDQATPSNQPTVKINTFNSVRGVLFDGVNDELVSNSSSTDQIFNPSNSTGNIWVVFRTPSSLSPSKQEILMMPETASGNTYIGLLLNGEYNTGDNGQSGYIANRISFRRQDRFANRAVINRTLVLTTDTTYVVRIFWGEGGNQGMQFNKLETPITTADTGDTLTTLSWPDSYPSLGYNRILGANHCNLSIGLLAIYNTTLTPVQVDENWDFIDSIWT